MNIYVGNLNNNTSEQHLRELFRSFGKIESVNIIMDTETGQSKGFAFVEMEDSADGWKAIRSLNGMNYMNQYLEVNEARPRPAVESRFVTEAKEKEKAKKNNHGTKGNKK